MKTIHVCWRKLALAGLGAGFFLSATVTSARASLGGDANSVDADVAALQCKISPMEQAPNQSASYKVKEFVTARGAKVREYFTPSGPVFGVAWEGRRPPDLSVLLGSYYSQYVSASSLKEHASLHHETIQGPDMIAVLGGHMGHLVGRAYVPGLAPSGVDPKAVVK